MQKSINWFAVILIISTVAIGSYKLGQQSVPITDKSEQIEKNLKEDLVSLTRRDFEEYQNLKSLEERYKKADEILGKIVTVFLADLGLKLKFKPLNPAMLAEGRCAVATTNSISSPQNIKKSDITPVNSLSSANTHEIPIPPLQANDWIKSEKNLLEIADEKVALAKLRKMAVPDFFSLLKETKDLTGGEIANVEGNFQGEIKFFNRDKHNTDWLIEWQVTVQSLEKAKGSSFVTLSKKSNGKVFSRSTTDNGLLSDFQKFDRSKSIILKLGGDNGYIQIYPLNANTDQWVGNFYEEKKIGTFDFAGQIHLNRVH